MQVLSAAFNVVHDGEGGSADVAQLLGKARGTVDHEVNPPKGSSAKFGLVDAVKVSKWRRDYRILYAFAEECGHICIPAATSTCLPDGNTEHVLSEASKLSGALAKTFSVMMESLSDGTVTPKELADFEREALDDIAFLAGVARSMRAKMEADTARHVSAVEGARREIA